MLYFDYSATTPVAPEVFEAMRPFLGDKFFNASSLYRGGRGVHAAIDEARCSLASLCNCAESEIVFTSGGTEADNTAIISGALYGKKNGRTKIVVSPIEHHAILESCEFLKNFGFEIVMPSVDRYGRVNMAELETMIDSSCALVSVMYVNNELGTIQDIYKICDFAHKSGALFHSDCVQALTNQDLDFRSLNADMISISSHKIYGPKGCGALLIKEGVEIAPFMHGGQQEGGRRGGTENVAGIVGFGKAATLLKESRSEDVKNMIHHKRIMTEIFEENNAMINSPENITSPSVLNVAFKDVEAEGMLFYLGMDDFCVSMGSACNSKSVEPSHVIKAINIPREYERGCIRLSFGHGQTDDDCIMLANRISELSKELKT